MQVLKTATCFGTKAFTSWSLNYKGIPAPIHQPGKYNAKY